MFTIETKISPTRNYHFDNLKVVLIFLVVFGHLIEPIHDVFPFQSLYFIIYSFHMPLFIFITGYFSKPNTNGLGKSFKTFIIFDIIYALTYVIVFQNGAGATEINDIFEAILFGLQPVWILWYLLSIIWWRLLLILYTKYPRLEILFIIIIIIFNLVPFNLRILSIGRTINFFPYFLLGYLAKVRNFNFEKIRKDKHTLIYLSIILIIFWGTYSTNISADFLYGTEVIFNEGIKPWLLLFFKVITYLVAIASSVVLISIVPRRKFWFSEIGNKTLPIYIYHTFFLWGLMKIGFYQQITDKNIILALITLVGLSFCIVMFLKDRRVL